MKKRAPTTVFTLLAFSALAACAPTDGVYIDPPAAAKSASVTLAKGTNTKSVSSQLRGLGLRTTRLSESQVSAAGNGPAFVDCGTITHYRNGNTSKFSGATPLSVIYTDPGTQDFLTREVAVETRVLVTLAGNQATVSERHNVTLFWTASDGSGSRRESKTVSAGETVTFADNTTCATGTSIAAKLR